ncbi:hypothetical protein, partial [Salmonella sp. SAL4431]|uniref:hypothetical protein n=1 Tax=Salmonella sp. SAL4431 TaxID=3159886 RepID=UPI00397AAC13
VTSGVMAGSNIAFSYDATTPTLTFTGSHTDADYEVAISHIYFQSTSENPTNYGASPTRTLAWQVQDAGGTANGGADLSLLQNTTVNINPI